MSKFNIFKIFFLSLPFCDHIFPDHPIADFVRGVSKETSLEPLPTAARACPQVPEPVQTLAKMRVQGDGN